MVKTTLILPDELHEQLRQEAFDNKVSMSDIVIEALQYKTPKPTKQIVIKTPKETFKVPDKGLNMCKHGSRLGLCKFGCK
jgi:hypothetical protein